jgi:hypothetical protein
MVQERRQLPSLAHKTRRLAVHPESGSAKDSLALASVPPSEPPSCPQDHTFATREAPFSASNYKDVTKLTRAEHLGNGLK